MNKNNILAVMIIETIISFAISLILGYGIGTVKKEVLEKENEIIELKNEIEFMNK